MKKLVLILTVIGLVSSCSAKEQKQSHSLSVNPVSVQTLKSKALTILKNSFSDDSLYIRNHAIEVALSTEQKQMFSEIIERTKDDSVAVRFTAAIAIGDMNCQTCEEMLLTMLKDTNENIQIAAAYALLKIGNKSHYQKIRDAAKSSDNTLRANALLLLGKIGNKDDMPILYDALKDLDVQDKVHLQAVDSLAMMKDIQIYKSKLWPLLISKYADDRVMGIRGMGALGTKEAIDAIITCLKDDVQEVRLVAAEELGRLGNSQGTEELIRYFETNPDLSKATMASGTAISAIGKLKANQLTGYLAKALDSQSPYLRLVAAQSVLKMAP